MTLPKGWVDTGLLEIVELHDNRRIPLNQSERAAKPGHYPYYGANGQVDTVGEYLFEGEYILLAEDGGYFDQPHRGVAYQVAGKFWVNNHAHILSALGDIPASFVRRALNCIDWMNFVSGTTRLKLTQAGMQRIRLPLPPLAEQRRIVAKLDKLTARLARARAELARAESLANRIRLSVLREVFRFDVNKMPSGWSRNRIDKLADVQLGRQRSPKDHSGPHMRPYLRAANITWSGWDLTDVKEMNFSPLEFETFRLNDGDVLLNEGSGSAKEVGKPAVWRGEIADVCFQNTLLRVRPFTYDSDLLRYCLLYLALSGQFIANTRGLNIIHIGKAGLSKFVIPEPPQSEQKSLLSRLNTAFAHADRLEAEAARARALLDRLESAILTKAFRGKLVPQDENDEPASLLLERIREERAARPKKVRTFRKSSAHA